MSFGSGRVRPLHGRRTRPQERQGALFGGEGKTVNCFRCGEEVPESRAKPFPPGAGPGKNRTLLCAECAGTGEEDEDGGSD